MQPAPSPPPASARAPAHATSGTTKLLVFGCLGLAILTALGLVAAVFFLGEKLVGRDLVRADLTPGVGAVLRFTDPGKGANTAWLDVDVTHTGGFRVMGDFTVTADGREVGAYHLDRDLSGRCANPVIGEDTTACVSWRFTQIGAAGTVTGRTRLFEIPLQASGAAVAVRGTLFVAGGVTVRRLALRVRD